MIFLCVLCVQWSENLCPLCRPQQSRSGLAIMLLINLTIYELWDTTLIFHILFLTPKGRYALSAGRCLLWRLLDSSKGVCMKVCQNESPVYNILMYSYDTYGLGHIRRTMAIANHLRDANTNVLILTGSPIAGRFQFPEYVDFVRIPGMIKKTNDDYQSLSIRIDQEKALAIRTNIILATARTFLPHLFIVDKEPLGLKRELLPTLEWLKESSPSTITILGLRDILDDSEVIQSEWREKNVYSYLDRLYDEIWIYGNRNIYDPIEMYKIPEQIHERIQFTGYIPRKKLRLATKFNIGKRYRVMEEDNFIPVTTGGGGDGYEVIDRYLAMHEYHPTSLAFKSIIG